MPMMWQSHIALKITYQSTAFICCTNWLFTIIPKECARQLSDLKRHANEHCQTWKTLGNQLITTARYKPRDMPSIKHLQNFNNWNQISLHVKCNNPIGATGWGNDLALRECSSSKCKEENSFCADLTIHFSISILSVFPLDIHLCTPATNMCKGNCILLKRIQAPALVKHPKNKAVMKSLSGLSSLELN